MKPEYYECGICGCYHRAEFNGDCRDDSERLDIDEIDDAHGGPMGWDEIEMPGTEGVE